MKKIIFDLDNTLMMFDKKYINSYCKVLKNNNFDSNYDQALSLFESVGRYEMQGKKYNKQDLLDFVNKDLNKNYKMKLVDEILDIIGTCWINPVSLELVDTLKYLSTKYELYVLTNWFTAPQAKRLENVGILKYFKKVVGADMVSPKPALEAFSYIIKDTNLKDCMMIGDNIDVDIKGALNAGIKTILYDYKNIYNGFTGNRIIKIEELKEML